MNLNSKHLYSNLHTDLSESERDLIIDDLLELQNEMKPLGIVQDKNDLLVLTDRSLIMVLMWQHELFAIKHFQQHCKEIPIIEPIPKVETKQKFHEKIFSFFRNIFKI